MDGYKRSLPHYRSLVSLDKECGRVEFECYVIFEYLFLMQTLTSNSKNVHLVII